MEWLSNLLCVKERMAELDLISSSIVSAASLVRHHISRDCMLDTVPNDVLLDYQVRCCMLASIKPQVIDAGHQIYAKASTADSKRPLPQCPQLGSASTWH